MNNDNMTADNPRLENRPSASNAAAIKDAAARTARKAYRDRIESLLDESSDKRLTDVWQRVHPFSDELTYEPDRRGIIKDLADFAQVLQPNLDGMKAHRLCRLIESYAGSDCGQSDLSISLLARLIRLPDCSGLGELVAALQV